MEENYTLSGKPPHTKMFRKNFNQEITLSQIINTL